VIRTKVLVGSMAAGIALLAYSPAGAAPDAGKCVSDALAQARAEGLTPKEAAARRGFKNPGAWLQFVRDTCGDVIEEPPGN
jgi:hypothetical protein